MIRVICGALLGLVQYGAIGEVGQEAPGVAQREGAGIRTFQGGVGQVCEHLADQRGLAGLTRTHHGDRLELTGQVEELSACLTREHTQKYNYGI